MYLRGVERQQKSLVLHKKTKALLTYDLPYTRQTVFILNMADRTNYSKREECHFSFSNSIFTSAATNLYVFKHLNPVQLYKLENILDLHEDNIEETRMESKPLTEKYMILVSVCSRTDKYC